MPYSGPNDPKLPKHVQALPTGKRSQWVRVFNTSLASCTSAGRSGCDGEAMRKANGVAKKEFDMPYFPVQCPKCEEWTGAEKGAESIACESCKESLQLTWRGSKDADDSNVEVDAKCGSGIDIVVEAPFGGGAMTYGEYETWRKAQEAESLMHETTWVFNKLLRNIMDNPDLKPNERANAIRGLADEMEDRLQDAASDVKEKPSLLERVRNLVSPPAEAPAEAPVQDPQAGFWVTQDKEGNARWLAVHTNKYFDREGEAFADAAHKEYDAWAEKTRTYPELWLFHVPGSKMGEADFVSYLDGFMLSSGMFTPEANTLGVPERLKELQGQSQLGVSHGYVFPEQALQDGVYAKYWTYEISPLPQGNAANLWTVFSAEMKEVGMPLEATRRKFLVDVLGEPKTAAIEESVAGMAKDLEANGVGFKALLEAFEKAEDDAPGDEAPATGEPAASEEEETPSGDAAGNDADDSADDEEEEPSSDNDEGDTSPLNLEGVAKMLKETVEPLAARLEAIEGRLKADETDDGSPNGSPRAAKTMGSQRPSQDPSNVDDAKGKALAGDDDNPDKRPSSASFANPYVQDLGGPRR